MLFNSLPFLFFLPVVFFLYWGLLSKSKKGQNILLLLASYFFFGWWDYKFLGLLLASTAIDYIIGQAIDKSQYEKRKYYLLLLSLISNLGILGFFKYYNFFIDSWQEAWASMGITTNLSSLNIILPVGISFYTFQTLSYTIDVYRGHLKPSRNFIEFAGFVSFFPQLVAGPIERASNLLPQFQMKRIFKASQAIEGLHLIIWGFFKKIVIADNCAVYVNEIFGSYASQPSIQLFLGAIFFAFQIYADFSGYSDIAIGVARLFGFELMRNFNYPYFSRNIGEFWRRWHISLSTWFRDYLYIPLGGSKGNLKKRVRNVFVIFLVSGLWHGANWTFVFWGAIHSLMFIPLIITRKNRKYLDVIAKGKILPSFKELGQILITFLLVCFAWIFFRAESLDMAFSYLRKLFSFSGSTNFNVFFTPEEIKLNLLIGILLLMEWFSRSDEHPFQGKLKWMKIYGILLLIVLFGAFSTKEEFIYFQF